MGWLWQNLVSGWVYAAIAAVFGIIVGFLKARGAPIVDPLLYGFGAFVLVFIGLAAVRASVYFKRDPPITMDNIEKAMRDWMDGYGYQVGRLVIPNTVFAFKVETPSQTKLQILKPKDSAAGQVLVRSTLTIDGLEREKLATLTSDQEAVFINQIGIEMARQRIGFSFNGPPLKGIAIDKYMPVVPDLAAIEFIRVLWDIELAMVTVRKMVAIKVADIPSPIVVTQSADRMALPSPP